MMASRPVDVPALVDAARAGSPRAVARLISLVEDGHPALREVMSALAPHTGRAHIFGITGSPGVGKSTLTNALVGALRARGSRVAIQALRARIGDLRHGQGVDELAGHVVDGTSDPYAAADKILAEVT